METTIKEFQEEIAGILNSDEWFGQHDINWLPEDTLNVEYEIKKNLGQTGMVAVVTTPSLDYQGEHKTVISKKNYEKVVDGNVTTWTLPDEQGRTVQVKKKTTQEKPVPWDELLEYVEFSGSTARSEQWINTGINLSNRLRIESEWTRVVTTLANMDFFGVRTSDGNQALFGVNRGGTKIYYQRNYAFVDITAPTTDLGLSYTVDFVNGVMEVNGQTRSINDPDNFNIPLFIGATNSNGSAVYNAESGTRFKSMKIYDGDELVRDFKPARVNGVVCLFDEVTQEFFYNVNAGGMDFIAGPVTQVAPIVEVTRYTVSGGCIPEGVEAPATPNETRQEIIDHTRYTVTLPMSGEDPTSVSVAMETGGIVGMPFDKKLAWIGVKENAWFDTGYVPKVNDRVMLRFATPYPQRIVLESAFATTATITGSTAFNYYSNVMNGAQMQMRRGSAAQNNTASFCKSGRFFGNGNSQRGLRDGVMFSGPGNNTETGTRPFGLGVFPVWNPTMPWENGTDYIQPPPFMQYIAATNANPTYSNNVSLALLGPNGGDNDIDNTNVCHCFRGKFHYFGIWHHLDYDDTPQFFGYPVLKDGKICIYDRVSGEVIQNSYVDGSNPKADPISAIEYEEDEDFNAIETDSSEAVFTEDVESVNKGFDVEVSLQVVENPTVNRGKPESDKIATALDVAHHAIYTLAGYDTEHFNDFSPATVRQSTVAGAGNKLLQVDARFRATPIL